MILIDVPFDKKMRNTTNKLMRMNKHARHKIKDDFLWWFKTLSKLEKPVDLPYPIKLHFLFIFGKSSRAYDSSNCSLMSKDLEDCMVINGWFKDDSIKYVQSVTYESRKGKEDHLTVSIL